MIVCICRRVSDHDIKRAAREGCASYAALQQQLGVATGCGACGECALRTFEHAQAGPAGAVSGYSAGATVGAAGGSLAAPLRRTLPIAPAN